MIIQYSAIGLVSWRNIPWVLKKSVFLKTAKSLLPVVEASPLHSQRVNERRLISINYPEVRTDLFDL
jgi:hypothetical protein